MLDASPSAASQVMIWNLDCPEQVIKNPVRTISVHTDVVLSMSFNTDASLLATTCKDKKVRLLEPRSGTLLQVIWGSYEIPVFLKLLGNRTSSFIQNLC